MVRSPSPRLRELPQFTSRRDEKVNGLKPARFQSEPGSLKGTVEPATLEIRRINHNLISFTKQSRLRSTVKKVRLISPRLSYAARTVAAWRERSIRENEGIDRLRATRLERSNQFAVDLRTGDVSLVSLEWNEPGDRETSLGKGKKRKKKGKQLERSRYEDVNEEFCPRGKKLPEERKKEEINE